MTMHFEGLMALADHVTRIAMTRSCALATGLSRTASVASIIAPLVFGLAAVLAPTTANAWWNDAFKFRAKITLNTSATGVETKEAVGALVVPVRLHSGNFDFPAAKEDGSDLRVIAADDKTPLRFTVERFDGVNELAVLWVPLQSLVPGSDKNVIHVYAGNPKVGAEPAVNVFDSGYAMVAHFAEAEGPAADASGSVKSAGAVVREPNGLLGGSARLNGEAVVWPAGDRPKLAAGGALSATLWIKPDNPTQGTLLQWGALKVDLAAGQVVLNVGGVKASGGSLPPQAWAQVGVSVSSGKATLFVNGAKAAEADVQLPALEGALSAGAGYSGLLDELQIIPAQRSAEWFKLSAAAQGADSKLVASVKEAPGDTSGGGEPGYMGILVKNLTVDAWVVIAILAVMFVIAAWVMVTKALFVGATDRDNRLFLKRFREASAQDTLSIDGAAAHPRSSLFRLYRAGVVQLLKRQIGVKATTLSGPSLDAVKAAIDADMVRESQRLNAKMVLLTIAISGGPFLGLLGTVAGVMITFAAIAAAGDVNVNAIAPGIASALLATVAGLAVAIPALFGYNYLASRIKNISSDMQIFVDEFVTRVAEVYGQR